MKVLLINPVSADVREVRKKCLPPQSLLFLGTQLKKSGFNVRVLDANVFKLGIEQIVSMITADIPALIGIPILSEIVCSVYQLTKAIKKQFPQIPIIMGGAHATAEGENVLHAFPQVDYVLRGESEFSMVELCRALDAGGDVSQIKGVVYRRGSSIAVNESADPPENLDDLGITDRGLLVDPDKEHPYYMLQMGPRRVESMITSRGCPHQCGFCANIRGKFRARSPENVIEEFNYLRQRGISIVDMVDTNFTLDRYRAVKIFDLLIKEKLGVSFRFKTRVDMIDEELIQKAKLAGCHLISYGMESGVQYILDRMNKRTTIKQNALAIEITKKAGLLCHAGWCLGYPGETPETIKKTVDFIIKIKPTTASISALMPYPGTLVYSEAQAEGTLMGAWSIHETTKPWVKLAWMKSYEDLEKMVRYAKNKVYYRPFYLINFSKNILKNANITLAKYIVQETAKSIKGLIKK
ncbi:MAG: radical SAM protein [bacterium]